MTEIFYRNGQIFAITYKIGLVLQLFIEISVKFYVIKSSLIVMKVSEFSSGKCYDDDFRLKPDGFTKIDAIKWVETFNIVETRLHETRN